jgi:hypothetical protein
MRQRGLDRRSTVILLVGGLSFAGACSPQATEAKPAEEESGGDSASPSDTGGPAPALPGEFTGFDTSKEQYPRGLTRFGEKLYVSFAPTGEVAKVDSRGRVSSYARVPFTAGQGQLNGLLADYEGQLYAALASSSVDVASGLYLLPEGGGEASLVATAEGVVDPQHLAMDTALRVYLTDSAGRIWRWDGGSSLDLWSEDPTLQGDPTACGSDRSSAFGASGILFASGYVYVTNADTGTLFRFPVVSDASAGPVEVVAGPDCALAGLDGLARTLDGRVFAAVGWTDRLVEIGADDSVTELGSGPPFDDPAAVLVDETDGVGRIYVASSALREWRAGERGAPAIVRMDIP